MKFRKPRPKKPKIVSPLGPMTNVPYLYLEYTCNTCKQVFSFVSGRRCSCELNHKFKAKPVWVNGIFFGSFKEAVRYSRLAFLEKNGLIEKLELQPAYPMVINEKKCGMWKGDFRFLFKGELVVEDVKGKETDVFKLKKKIIEALYPGIKICLT